MASPAIKYNLVFYVNGKQWRVTPVSLKKPICFGMSEKCNVRLSSTGTLDLLDEHAWLLIEGDQIKLKVAGKTKVNGEEIPVGVIPYNVGDKIQFGEKDKLLLVLEVPALGEQPEPAEKKKEKKPKEKKTADSTKSPKEKKKATKENKATEEKETNIEVTQAVEGSVASATTTTEENKTETTTPIEEAPVIESESPKTSPKNQKNGSKGQT
jgi:pSer/pThr/pTyr-binding forkhead associated (FHA) protein